MANDVRYGNYQINDPRDSMDRLMKAFQMLGESIRQKQALEEAGKQQKFAQDLSIFNALENFSKGRTVTPELQAAINARGRPLGIPEFNIGAPLQDAEAIRKQRAQALFGNLMTGTPTGQERAAAEQELSSTDTGTWKEFQTENTKRALGQSLQEYMRLKSQPETPELKTQKEDLLGYITSLNPEMAKTIGQQGDMFKINQYMRNPNTGELLGIGQDKEGNVRTVPVPGSQGMEFTDVKVKPIPAERATALTTGLGNLDRLERIDKLFNKMMIGPAAGNINKAASLLKNNPEFIKFRWNIEELRTIVYQLSGKQINESEQEWLQKQIIPSIANPDQNFKAKFGELKSWLKQKMRDDFDTMDNIYYIKPRLRQRIEQHLSTIETPQETQAPTAPSTKKWKIISVEGK